ncbi:MAG: ABC-F family ATP-binding cassette domain-containing protein [Rhodospirillaceae bacterium]|jgi:ATP-binding cassette, subfamily F, member 3|nr:ABC-F family ATP-binding cassette domain-containing protein [Rhodospirillaceae bacterium]MBT4588617.1 ABC-F family ATP-binding cassette domain-containing protein [Rhodospirillaceae bacterium]MBT7266278.1 ABC-F family ATP-binding cassette domain-containing protein [Rhodospirillaceae bacterium]
MLHINDMTFRIGARALYENATIAIPDGQKVGLVGRNGTGKTTLFRLIMDELTPDEGAISINEKHKIGTVAQEAPAGPESLLDTVLAADVERSALLTEAETATDPGRISDIHIRLADIRAESAPARAATILSGLGFPEETQHRPCSDFSGGWRMRVALAATLFAEPDLLLLDEPTNHLDLEAVLWLENFLKKWRGTLVVISHERTLLNRSVDHIIHLENGRLTRYTGGYDFFEKTRRERLVLQSKMAARQIAERQRIQSFVDRFRAKANKARQAQSRVKMLERMEPIASVIEEKTISFEFPHPPLLSPPLIALNRVSVGYEPGKPILRDVDLRIDMDDRIALIGANGNGKSTMMKLLAGRLSPEEGKLVKSKKLEVGYFAQHQSEELNPDGSAFDHISEKRPMEPPARLRGHLGRFGFVQERADTKVANLSGGEKARLLFALMSLDKPHIMLLDEPTNHLDIDSREALVEALNFYEGAVILVSHDVHLVSLVADQLWLVDDGKCEVFDGDLAEYEKLLLETRSTKKSNGNGSDTAKPKENKKEARRLRAEKRQETAHFRKAVTESEKKIEKLNAKIEEIETKMADPKFYENSPDEIAEWQKLLGKAKKDLEENEAIWLEATEALDGVEV